MPLPSSINDLSTTAGSNSPAGSESPSLIDDYLRTYASYIALLRDGGINKASTTIGTASNVKMTLAAAAASATLTATEIIVGSALGGSTYILANFSKTINLATTGAGGMDTGTAPVNGFVAVYAIYNLSSGVSALLATNATSVTPGEVYGGANMPSGYIASALVAVWPTNGSSQFKIGSLRGRRVSIPGLNVLTSATVLSTATLSIASTVPRNATSISGGIGITNSGATSTMSLSVMSDVLSTGLQVVSGNNIVNVACNFDLDLSAMQSMVYTSANTTGTPGFSIFISGYRF